MTIKNRAYRAYVCDACGYNLPSDRYTKLELAYRVDETEKGKLELHFHESSKEHDCLRYWIMNAYTIRRTLSEDHGLSDRAVEVIMKTVGGFKGAPA